MKGFLMLLPLNEGLPKILFSDNGHLLASFRTEREKFYPGSGLEPGPVVLRASALTT